MADEWKRIYREVFPALPGLILVLGVALLSRSLHALLPGPRLNKALSEVLLALAIGLFARNAFTLPVQIETGVKFALSRILRIGIILLGLRLSLQDVGSTGLAALALVVICVVVSLALAHFAGRIFHIPPRLAALIGVGTAICGNSAIVATAPVIEAKDEEVSFAVATITIFGTLAVLSYPLIGHAFGFTDRVFGMWAGTAVNDTSQVVAAGAAFSGPALDVATVVKLTRNTLMAPTLLLIGLVYSRAAHRANRASLTWSALIPGFVLGFLSLSLLRTAGVALGWLPRNADIPGELQAAASALRFFDAAARFCILVALSAVGLNTSIRSMLKIGLRPFVVGLCVALALAALSLSLIAFAGLGR